MRCWQSPNQLPLKTLPSQLPARLFEIALVGNGRRGREAPTAPGSTLHPRVILSNRCIGEQVLRRTPSGRTGRRAGRRYLDTYPASPRWGQPSPCSKGERRSRDSPAKRSYARYAGPAAHRHVHGARPPGLTRLFASWAQLAEAGYCCVPIRSPSARNRKPVGSMRASTPASSRRISSPSSRASHAPSRRRPRFPESFGSRDRNDARFARQVAYSG